MTRPSPHERRFAEYLGALATRGDGDARATLAALRRGLGKEPGEAAEATPYVFRWLGQDADSDRVDAYFQVAALFASHRISWGEREDRRPTNLGASFWRLAHREGQTEDPGAERRLVALLNAHPEELGRHLRHAVSLLKAHEIPIDWAQLLRDIQEWTYEERPVQFAWARSFWGGGATADDADAAATESSDTTRPAGDPAAV